MKNDTTKGFPDFGELREVFGHYKASIRKDDLLDDHALDRMFADAPARISSIRKVRMKWGVGITGLAVVTATLLLFFAQGQEPTQMPQRISTSQAPQKNLTGFNTISPISYPSKRVHTKFPWDTTSKNAKSTFVPKPLEFPNMRELTFRASEREYPDNADLDSVVAHDPALGPGWKVADWGDLVQYSLKHPIQELIDEIHWAVFDTDAKYPDLTTTNQFWVRYNGKNTLPEGEQHFRTSTNEEIVLRHFFVTRFHHHVPPNFLPHAEIDDNEIVLGSWYDWKFRVLAVRKENNH